MNYVGPRYVRNIRGLLIPLNADHAAIAKRVEEYVETIPALAERMKRSLKNNRLPEFEASLNTVIALLDSVQSKWLLNEAKSIWSFLRIGSLAMCEKKALPLISKLLSLSIEMQTAKNQKAGGVMDDSTVEFYNDILHNLIAARDLINQSDYDNAIDIITGMSVLDNDRTAVMLISALRSREKPVNLIVDLIDKYKNEIEAKLERQANSQYKILLVDDRPEILNTLTGYLSSLYKVFALTSGNLALEFLEKQRPDLFILDIDMPEMDGIALTRRIRGMREHEKTPIIILTGNAKREYVVAALQAGANDFLVKPPNKDMILAKVFTRLSSLEQRAA